jgi:predicted acylesterase/phospholipase RssA
MRPRQQWHDADAGTFTSVSPAALLRAPEETTSRVLRVILERVRAGSAPRAREDEHLVCLAIEGGGMRGAVSAGMCLVLEAAGLASAFDRIYGVSAGALNGWATAAGQAALSATHYEDAARRGVINRMRPLLGRPVIDFDLLFDDVIAARKPLSFERLASGPEFRALAVSLETMSLRVLDGFADGDELRQAVRASASLPRLGGRAPVFRGERMADGGLIEPIPFQTAMAEGATHVLVLRTRPAGYRKPAVMDVSELLALRDDPRLLELVRARHGIYNRQAAALEHDPDVLGQVLQVAVPDGTRLIGRLQSDPGRVIEALRLGARAMASVLLSDAVDLCWQPVVYGAALAEPSVEPVRAPTRRWRSAILRAGARAGSPAS